MADLNILTKFNRPRFTFQKMGYSLHTSDIVLQYGIMGILVEQLMKGWDPKTQEEFNDMVHLAHKSMVENLSALLDHGEDIGAGRYSPKFGKVD